MVFAVDLKAELDREIAASSECEHCYEPLDHPQEAAGLLQWLRIEGHGEVTGSEMLLISGSLDCDLSSTAQPAQVSSVNTGSSQFPRSQ